MVNRKQAEELREIARKKLEETGIFITQKEYDEMDVADFGHNNCLVEGGQMVALAPERKLRQGRNPSRRQRYAVYV